MITSFQLRTAAAAALIALLFTLVPIPHVSGAMPDATVWADPKNPPPGQGGGNGNANPPNNHNNGNSNNNNNNDKDQNKGGNSNTNANSNNNSNNNTPGNANASSNTPSNATHASTNPQTGRNVTPIARDDRVDMTGGRQVNVKVLENDEQLNNGPVTVRIVISPAFGRARVNSDNSITYVELNPKVSSDNLIYQVCDQQKDCALATLYFNIRQPIVKLGSDGEPPEISWERPVKDGEIYMAGGEGVTLLVNAEDNKDVASVHFLRWDAANEEYIPIEIEHSSPWDTALDTSTLNPGWNQIFARSYDTSGNASDYQFIWIYLQ